MATQPKEKKQPLIIPTKAVKQTTTQQEGSYMLDRPEILQYFIQAITQLEYQLEILLAAYENNRIKTPLK